MRRPLAPSALRRARALLPTRLHPLADRARDLVHDVRGVAALSRWVSTIHRGPLPHGGPEVRVQYLGRTLFERDALLALRPPDAEGAWRREVRHEGGLGALALARGRALALSTTDEDDVDVVVIDPLFAWADAGPSRAERYRYPVFLRGTLAVAPSLEEQLRRVRSKPYRRVLKRAAREAPTWRTSRSEGDLREFYDAMYEPLARQRFGDAATVSSYERLLTTLRERGELLLVEREGVPLIGALLYRSAGAPGTVFNWKYGVRDPASLDAASLRERTASLEVALFAHARARGDTHVDFGLTQAVADDGVFVHKRRLGCDFTPLPRGPELLVRFIPGAEPVVLERAPLFVRHARGLACLAGYAGARSRDGEPRAARVLREHGFEGCEATTLFTLEDEDLDDVIAGLATPVDVVRRTRSRHHGASRTGATTATAADNTGASTVEEAGADRAHPAPSEAPARTLDV